MATSPQRSWLRRKILRRLVYLVLSLLCILVFLLGLLHSSWGLVIIKNQLVQALQDKLNGSLEIGELSGSVLHCPTLTDIAVYDKQGQAVIKAEAIEVCYRLLSVFDNTLELSEVNISKPWIVASKKIDNTWNLSDLVKPSPANTPDSTPTWTIQVDQLALREGQIDIISQELTLRRMSAISVDLGLHMQTAPFQAELRLERLAGLLEPYDLVVSLDFDIRVAGPIWQTNGLHIQLGASRFDIKQGSVSADGSAAAEFSGQVSQPQLRLLGLAFPHTSDLALQGSCLRKSSNSDVMIELKTSFAQSSMDARLNVAPDLLALDGTLELQQVDPHAFAASAPAGTLNAQNRLQLSWADVQRPQGHLTGKIYGRLGDTQLKQCTYRLDLTGDKNLQGQIKLQTPQGQGQFKVGLVLDKKPYQVDYANLLADFSRLDFLGIKGKLRADVKAKGSLHDLSANGRVALNQLEMGEIGLERFNADLAVCGLGQSFPKGGASFVLQGLKYKKQVMDTLVGKLFLSKSDRLATITFESPNKNTPYGLEGRVQIRKSKARTSVVLDKLAIKTQDLLWTANRVKIGIGPNGFLSASPFWLSSSAGRIATHLRRVKIDDPLGTIDANLKLDKLRLKPVMQSLPADLRPQLCGVVDLSFDAKREAANVRIVASGSLDRVCLFQQDPSLDATFRTSVENRQVRLQTRIVDDRLGHIKAGIRFRMPPYPTQIESWKKQGVDLIERLSVELNSCDLASLSERFIGKTNLQGKLSGRMSAGAGLTVANAAVTVENIKFFKWLGRLRTDLDLSLSNELLQLKLQAADQKEGRLKVSSTFHMPHALIRQHDFHKMGLQQVKSFEASLSSFAVSSLDQVLDEAPTLAARLHGLVRYHEHDPSIFAQLNISQIDSPAFKQELFAEIIGNIESKKTNLEFNAGIQHQGIIQAQAELQAGYSDLLQPNWQFLMQKQLDAQLKVVRIPLRQITQTLAPQIPLKGEGEARARINGTLQNPNIWFQSSLESVRLGETEFDSLALDVSTQQKAYEVRLQGKKEDRKVLEWEGAIARTTYQPLHFNLRTNNLRIRPFVLLLNPVLSLSLDLDGWLDADLQWAENNKGALEGFLQLHKAAWKPPLLLPPIEEGTLEARFRQGWVQLDSSAYCGSGTLGISADLEMEGWVPKTANVDLATYGVPLYTGGSPYRVDLDSAWIVQFDKQLINASGRIRQANLRIPELIGESLHDTSPMADVVWSDQTTQNAPVSAAITNKKISAFAARVQIESEKPISVKNQEVAADLNLALEVSLIRDAIAINGKVDVKTGFASIFSRRYQIARGKAVFAGLIPPVPQIDLVLTHDFGSLTIKIQVMGPASGPKVSLSSDPAIYDQAQLLSFVLGKNPDDSLQASQNLEERALNLASGLLLSKVENEVKRALPIDTLRLEPKLKQGKTEGQLVVGKWLTDKIFVAYRYKMGTGDDENTHEASVTYRLAGDWVIEGTYGNKGKRGLDILWVKRF